MKTIKQKIKEEFLIFIHNFFTVLFILCGYTLLTQAPDLLGNIIGFITLSYGIYLLFSAIKKGVDEFIKTYHPTLFDDIKKIKKGD